MERNTEYTENTESVQAFPFRVFRVFRGCRSLRLTLCAIVALTVQTSVAQLHPQTDPHRLILSKLKEEANLIPRCAISYEETINYYQLPDRRTFLDAIKSGRDVSAATGSSRPGAATHTNIVHAKFWHWQGGGKIVRRVFDVSGALRYNSGAYFGEDFLSTYTQEVGSDSVDTLKSGWGEVNTRQRGDYSGAPVFLRVCLKKHGSVKIMPDA